MNLVIKILLVVPFAALIACSSDNNSNSLQKEIVGFEINKDEFNAYVKLKGIPTEVGARYDRATKVFAEQNALAAVIAKEVAINTPELRADLKESRNEIIIKHYFDDYVDKTVNDAAIEAYYQSNAASYTTRKARIAQILLTSSVSANAADRMSKMEMAKKLAEDLRNGGDFAKAVMKYSDDVSSKNNQGDIGWVTEGSSHHALASIAVAMNEGDISEPIEMPNGILILKVLEGPVSEVQPLANVKEKIAYKLKYDAKLKEMERLKKSAASLAERSLEKLN